MFFLLISDYIFVSVNGNNPVTLKCNIMQNLNERVEEYLKDTFDKVRETEKGFKINVQQLSRTDIGWLYGLECTNDIVIKRSGTGMVIIIE